LGQRECAIIFVSVTWIAVTGFAAIIAGTGLVGDRSRGFLELVLMTPMSPREIIAGGVLTVWQHMQRLFWLPVFLCLFFVVTGATWITEVAPSVLIAGLFLWLLILHGTVCCLAARTMAPALTMTVLLPVLMIALVPFIGAIFREACGPALGIIGAIFLAAAWYRARKKTGVATVGSYLLAVHLALVLIATCWTWKEGRNAEPILAINPGVMTIVGLASAPTGPRDPLDLEGMQWCYMAALTINIFYIHHWAIRNFDRLTGRCGDMSRPAGPARQGVQSGSATATTNGTVVEGAPIEAVSGSSA
jgi:hypothetical protein